MIDASNMATAVQALLQQATEGYDERYGYGSMSVAIYDTAWVSLITDTRDTVQKWLFPQCFDYLLESQLPDGSWGQTGSQIDGILNTASSLLSLLRHYKRPLQLRNMDETQLKVRIDRASQSLQHQLQSWSVSSTIHVGFEIITPALLDLLLKEDETLNFHFHGRSELIKLNSIKLSGFREERLYGNVRHTALHSLEAFIDKIDFDKIIHHKVCGSMMGSPASTAAYMMARSGWDDEAEAYLTHVINAGGGMGGLPSAYPSMHFEYSWVSSRVSFDFE